MVLAKLKKTEPAYNIVDTIVHNEKTYLQDFLEIINL